ncbi:hypothetical protein [Actinoplanes solisilvae]|nr:hypothetical protein [Actinoplanes solisilvae]
MLGSERLGGRTVAVLDHLKLGGRILYRLVDIEAYEERALVTGVSA